MSLQTWPHASFSFNHCLWFQEIPRGNAEYQREKRTSVRRSTGSALWHRGCNHYMRKPNSFQFQRGFFAHRLLRWKLPHVFEDKLLCVVTVLCRLHFLGNRLHFCCIFSRNSKNIIYWNTTLQLLKRILATVQNASKTDWSSAAW